MCNQPEPGTFILLTEKQILWNNHLWTSVPTVTVILCNHLDHYSSTYTRFEARLSVFQRECVAHWVTEADEGPYITTNTRPYQLTTEWIWFHFSPIQIYTLCIYLHALWDSERYWSFSWLHMCSQPAPETVIPLNEDRDLEMTIYQRP